MTVSSNRADGSRTYTLRDGGSIMLQMVEELDSSAHSAPLIGALVWPASIALSMWLADAAQTGRVQMRGSRVLELGAGLGLPGMLLGTLAEEWPERVVLSDFALPLLENLRQNVALNAASFEAAAAAGEQSEDGEPLAPTIVDVAGLNWDETTDEVEATYDVPLLKTVLRQSTSHPVPGMCTTGTCTTS